MFHNGTLQVKKINKISHKVLKINIIKKWF